MTGAHPTPPPPWQKSRAGGYRPWRSLRLLALLATFAVPGLAQSLQVGDAWEDYLRVLQVRGLAVTSAFTVRPFASQATWDQLGPHPWQEAVRSLKAHTLGPFEFTAEDLQFRAFANTDHPWGQNDSAVWQGRGLSTEWSGGGTLKAGPITLRLRPSVIWTQNRDFPLVTVPPAAGRSTYANPYWPGMIDLPQRFGPSAYWTFDPGQSSLRIEGSRWAFGLSTENLWWGPGIQNGILMSNNAAGFPHAFLGTVRPVSVGIGKLEGQWIWGRLQESDYADKFPKEKGRYITGLVMDFEPNAMKGLHLGLSRLFYEQIPAGGLGTSDYLGVFQKVFKKDMETTQNPGGNDQLDQFLSLFFPWVLPESGFEVYYDWARNDHNWDSRDLILEPEHSQGYTYGLQKVQTLASGHLLRIKAEVTNLQEDTTKQQRATGPFYPHHLATQGYTQRGQVIGAGLGPGGSAQYLGFDVFTPWGRWGGYLQRQVHDNDTYYALAAKDPSLGFRGHDVDLAYGGSVMGFWHRLELTGSLTWIKEYNRAYILRNDQRNLNLAMSLRWRL